MTIGLRHNSHPEALRRGDAKEAEDQLVFSWTDKQTRHSSPLADE
jgi:hypothetical protein